MGVVRRYIYFVIILLISTPLVLAFFQQHPYFLVHCLNVFLFFRYYKSLNFYFFVNRNYVCCKYLFQFVTVSERK